jgi:hypothetical protein
VVKNHQTNGVVTVSLPFGPLRERANRFSIPMELTRNSQLDRGFLMNAPAKLLFTSLAMFSSFGGGIDWEVPVFGAFNTVSSAQARIGHPLTPLSYAGVARRTARRTVRREVARLTVLPPGCIYGPYNGGYYYKCGGVYYARSGGAYVEVIVK